MTEKMSRMWNVRFVISAVFVGGELAKCCLGQSNGIGGEVGVPHHLRVGDESTLSIMNVLSHGQLLFEANWTDQEGGGRPQTKGTGRPVSDPSHPLTGRQSFNRISGP